MKDIKNMFNNLNYFYIVIKKIIIYVIVYCFKDGNYNV